MYYSNITYLEDYLKINHGFKYLNVYIHSINVAFSNLNTGDEMIDLARAKSDLADAINFVRKELGQKFMDNSINTNQQATDFFIKTLNSILNAWFTIGGADLKPVNNMNPLPLEHTGLYYPFP